MKTAGEILKQAREARGLKIEPVAKATKIRPFYLKALETDDYSKLPSLTSTRGFIKNYADFLGLSSKKVLAVFRRDFDDRKAVDGSGEAGLASMKPGFKWTPGLTTMAALLIFGLAFIAYLIWQYRSLIEAPYY